MTNSRRRNKGLRWTAAILLVTGIALVGYSVGSRVISVIYQKWENRQFEEEIRGKPPVRTHVPNSVPRPQRPAQGSLLGRLSIPRLGLSDMVREGDDETTLNLALGHIPSTGMPGVRQNVGIAGHRDTLFRALRNIRKGDMIRFETLDGNHTYQVDSTQIVKPEDVGVLKAGTQSQLTLVTCYPFYYVGAAPERFIVSAHEDLTPAASEPSPIQEVHVNEPESPAALHEAQDGSKTTSFSVSMNRKREVAPGISIEVTGTDTSTGTADGSMWLMPEHRRVYFHHQAAGDPLVFSQEGRRRELLITRVSENTMTASLLLASGRP